MAKQKQIQLKWFGDDLASAVKEGGEPALWRAGQVLARELVNRTPSKSN